MVTTRKTSESKVIAMDDKTGGAAVPPKTLLEEVNPQLMCVLCHGYYIDATTIVECLHSFCRSCIIKHLQVKSYCPICEMMINSAKPNIKPDKALQDIVYKLVPGLFQREMQRRQAFYASRPGPAASATPEQRGEDTERIIFSPEDVISFSLEYMDCTENESASSRSSESGNESMPCNETGAPTRRYLQCPAVVNISHLKKFLSMKYDVDVTHFFVDILYKRVPLPDYYTLMDIAYIYNWKRNEPMRFFYQISDFTAIRDRFGFFGLKRPGTLLGGRKGKGGGGTGGLASPAPASPAPSHLTEAGSDASSGSFSPIPHEKSQSDFTQDRDSDRKSEIQNRLLTDASSQDSFSNTEFQASPQSSSSMDVEKSQFLNSFELTAKCSVGSGKCSGSPTKDSPNRDEKSNSVDESGSQVSKNYFDTSTTSKVDASPGKRKSSSAAQQSTEGKKAKLTPEKNSKELNSSRNNQPNEISPKELRSSSEPHFKMSVTQAAVSANKPVYTNTTTNTSKTFSKVPSVVNTLDQTHKTAEKNSKPSAKSINTETNTRSDVPNSSKKTLPNSKPSPVKRKLPDEPSGDSHQVSQNPKPTIILKPEPPKDSAPPNIKNIDNKEKALSSAPLKPTAVPPKTNVVPRIPNKPDNVLKTAEPKKETPKPLNPLTPRPSLRLQSPKTPKPQGDPLKSLFDSCNINIPSSLSITLTDQKLENKPGETSENVPNNDSSKQTVSNNTSVATSQSQPNLQQKTPSQVHNYIEILKLPETEASTVPTKVSEEKNKSLPSAKPADGAVSAKGPVPNLKPISDSKQVKTVPITKPQTFQQTFLQSLQQQSEKPKFIKTRIEFPKTTPVTTKPEEVTEPTPAVVTKPTPTPTVPTTKYKPIPMAQPIRKPNPLVQPKVTKPDSALDLSTPHTVQSQLGPQQTKALETMQSIANLAKRQSYTQRMTSPSQVFSQESFKMNTTNASPIRIPVPPTHSKHLKTNNSTQVSSVNSPKHFSEYFPSVKPGNTRTNNGSPVQNTKSSGSQSTALYNQRSQTRSPSSSPKLVIACPSPKSQSPEEKQLLSPRGVDVSSQSSMISSSQISSTNHANNESTSKDVPKPIVKSQVSNKSNPRSGNSNNQNKASTSGNGSSQAEMVPQILAQQAYLRQQLELQTQLGLLPPGAAAQWFNNPVARAHFENIMKNMTHNTQMSFSNNHSSKDNK